MNHVDFLSDSHPNSPHPQSQSSHASLSSVFAAAVVSQSFCQLLLSRPEQALRQGYMGQQFRLSAEDTSLIVSMNAHSLKDLAKQVVRTLG